MRDSLVVPERVVAKAIAKHDKRAQQLANETVDAYERARREILGLLLAGEETALTVLHLRQILAQVQDRLGVLYKDVRVTWSTALTDEVRTETAQALKEIGHLPITDDAKSLIRIMSPRIPHGMVDNMITGSLEHITAVNDDLVRKLRGELTQSMIRGEGVQKAAKRLLAQGLTTEGTPAFTSAKARAVTIARTEMSLAANTAHVETYKKLKEQLPGLKMRWVSAMCSRTCGRCRSYHGDLTNPGEAFPRSGLSCPPAHPRCLCRVVAEVVRQ